MKILKHTFFFVFSLMLIFLTGLFIKGIYLESIDSINLSNQYKKDIISLSERDICLKYYADYKVDFLPVKCLKYFK